MTEATQPLLSARNLCKSFPGVKALDDVGFDLMPGEVHALMGENGAGKSTLMRVFAGIYAADSGEIRVGGKPVTIDGPRSAQALGISIIHQELNLMNHLSAAKNIFIGREPLKAFSLMVDEDKLNADAGQMFKRFRLNLDPRTPIGELTVARQQMVEISKALSFQARILIMDEPTAALNEAEINDLFSVIRELQAQGVGIIYISHKMDELKRISNRITVMRDGRYVGTVPTATTEVNTVIHMMVGRSLEAGRTRDEDKPMGEVALEVKNLSRGSVLKNISFTARKGEILGLAGLMGAGRTELARAIFGADKVASGEIYVNGKRVDIKSPANAVRQGIGYLSEDRKQFGLITSMDVRTNIVIAHMRKFLSLRFLFKHQKATEAAQDAVLKLAIKTPGVMQKVALLSGGNQQKIVIAKWLLRDCDILFFDEPTRGIDVGAKREIYNLLHDLADQGRTVIMISSELPEILRMSSRILVMCEGRITGELSAAEATQESIMHFATQRTIQKTTH